MLILAVQIIVRFINYLGVHIVMIQTIMTKLICRGQRMLIMSKYENLSNLFDLYWENTNLNDKNILNFVNNFINEEKDIERIKYHTNDVKLDYPKDKLYEIMKMRESGRNYNNYQINKKQLSSLFSGFAEIDKHRLLSSAGGKYPIEVPDTIQKDRFEKIF